MITTENTKPSVYASLLYLRSSHPYYKDRQSIPNGLVEQLNKIPNSKIHYVVRLMCEGFDLERLAKMSVSKLAVLSQAVTSGSKDFVDFLILLDKSYGEDGLLSLKLIHYHFLAEFFGVNPEYCESNWRWFIERVKTYRDVNLFREALQSGVPPQFVLEKSTYKSRRDVLARYQLNYKFNHQIKPHSLFLPINDKKRVL